MTEPGPPIARSCRPSLFAQPSTAQAPVLCSSSSDIALSLVGRQRGYVVIIGPGCADCKRAVVSKSFLAPSCVQSADVDETSGAGCKWVAMHPRGTPIPIHVIRALRIDTLPAMRTTRTAIPSGDAFPPRSSVLSHRWDRLGTLLRDSQTLYMCGFCAAQCACSASAGCVDSMCAGRSSLG